MYRFKHLTSVNSILQMSDMPIINRSYICLKKHYATFVFPAQNKKY